MNNKYAIEVIVYVEEGHSFLEWITSVKVKNFFHAWKTKDNLNEISQNGIYAEYNPGLGKEELLDKARIKKFKEGTEIFYLLVEVDNFFAADNWPKYNWRRIEDDYFPLWFQKNSIFNEYF